MPRSWALAATIVACSLTLGAQQSSSTAPPPTFRAGVDLVAVDVQVVGKDGRPITGLRPDAFAVTIEGHQSPVVSAEFIDYTRDTATNAPLPITPFRPSEGRLTIGPGPPPTRGRLIILAVDCMSFDVGLSRGVVEAAQTFLSHLNPNDLVGVFAYPLGPKLDPTTDHAAVAKALNQIVGERETAASRIFALTASDVVDLSFLGHDVRGTASALAGKLCGRDPSCMKQLEDEEQGRIASYEAQGTASLGMLKSVIQALGKVQGQKILVLASAGMVVSDVPGGRPDLGDVGIDVGKEAAVSDVTVYTLFMDQNWLELNAAETRQGRRDSVPNYGRDSAILGRWLDQFSGESGGAMMSVLAGNGDYAYDRILSETSGYYLLAVVAPDRDRDGRTHPIKVKVNAKDATVRAREWVAIPKPAPTQPAPR